MARLKQTVMQRDFSFGELREDFLEGDDVEVRQASLQAASNVRSLATRAIEQRPGTFLERVLLDAKNAYEVRPGPGLRFGLLINDTSLEVINEDGDLVWSTSAVRWTSGHGIWVESYRERIVLGGSFGLSMLKYDKDSATWSLSAFEFEAGPGGEIKQPYWVFDKNTSIAPSAYSGTVTVVATGFTWSAAWVGLRIRYLFREILITEYVNPTTVIGTVTTELPPSFTIMIQDGSEFQIGDSVIGQDTDFQGSVVGKSGNAISVVTTEHFDGPDVGEELSAGTGSSEVTAVTKLAAPLTTTIWDEQLMSDLRGWPRSGSTANGRLILVDFAQAESVIALSSTRAIEDFKVGAQDDDAIVREIGDNAPRWLHVVNMSDIVLLADNGCYIIPIRENGILTPNTFNAVLVDETGSSEISPVRVRDGVVFIEAGGATVSAMLLDGNVYLKWSVRSLTRYYNHLIKTPMALCGPTVSGVLPEKYVFVINSDGTMATLSYDENVRKERVGFVPWDTDGEVVGVTPMFDFYWMIVRRTFGTNTKLLLERMSLDATMDCVVEAQDETPSFALQVNGEALEINGGDLLVGGADLTHAAGGTLAIYSNGWDAGDFTVASDGTLVDEAVFDGSRQIGLPFTVSVQPWPVEIIESPRVGTLRARVLQFIVSVQNSLGFTVRCNKYERTVAGYLAGDDLTVPPVPRTQLYHFAVFGNRDHPEMVITKTRPGPLRILALGQRVQA